VYGTTKFSDWPLTDCACKPGPSYFIDYGIDSDTGKHRVESAGRNRKLAEQALRKRQTEQDEGSLRFRENIKFSAWADEWLKSFKGKESTRRVYGQTLAYAKRAFGSKSVRELSTSDVRRFLDLIERETADRSKPKAGADPRQAKAGTLAKHLRQLGACLSAAVAEGFAAENPVRRLHKTLRPKVQKSRPSFFTNEELPRLFAELDERPVYAALFKLALTTGLRSGELLALRWSDCHLLRNEIEIQRTLTPDGETAPKSGEARTVDLTPAAAGVLAAWFKESGAAEFPDRLVFQKETSGGGFLDPTYLTRGVLYKALTRAGIAREGEGGRPRTFHSLRHSFARIALEGGAELTWTQRQLGHASIVLTSDVYGHWSRSAQKAQAQRLEGAFPI
jgi:integrase